MGNHIIALMAAGFGYVVAVVLGLGLVGIGIWIGGAFGS